MTTPANNVVGLHDKKETLLSKQTLHFVKQNTLDVTDNSPQFSSVKI